MKTTKKESFLTSVKLKMTLLIMIMVLSVVTVSYGFFLVGESQSGVSTIESSCFNTRFTEGESINLTNAMSVSDTTGQNSKPYTFTITNTCDLEAKYTVLLNVKTGSFDDSHINLSLNKYTPSVLNSHDKNIENIGEGYTNSYILQSGSLKKDGSVTYDLRLWINSATTYEDVQGQTWEGQIKVVTTVKTPTMIDRIIASAKTGNPNFSTVATTDEGVYTMEDDYGTSYYFRGSVENNYVKFAGFYWRIIRINGDGTLRILYDGTYAHPNGELSNEEEFDRFAHTGDAYNSWNLNEGDAKYVGYMYGGLDGEASTSKEQAQTNETPSNMKTQLENWYNTNISNTYRNAIADVPFCNDRSTPDSSYATGYGGSVRTNYGARVRLQANKNPSFKCIQDNDKFTVNTNTGNGKLLYPVGLMTADELAAAGGVNGLANKNYYPFKGYTIMWSFSPNYSGDNYSYMYMMNTSGLLTATYVTRTSSEIAPVINLTAEYAESLIGDGSMTNPYRERGMEP